MGKIQGFNDFTESLNEAKTKCPPATQDIKLNLRNRQKAIDEFGYGPLNPSEPNKKFWDEKSKSGNWILSKRLRLLYAETVQLLIYPKKLWIV